MLLGATDGQIETVSFGEEKPRAQRQPTKRRIARTGAATSSTRASRAASGDAPRADVEAIALAAAMPCVAALIAACGSCASMPAQRRCSTTTRRASRSRSSASASTRCRRESMRSGPAARRDRRASGEDRRAARQESTGCSISSARSRRCKQELAQDARPDRGAGQRHRDWRRSASATCTSTSTPGCGDWKAASRAAPPAAADPRRHLRPARGRGNAAAPCQQRPSPPRRAPTKPRRTSGASATTRARSSRSRISSRSIRRARLAPRAQYWIGDSYYNLRDFRLAIASQQKLIATYPDSATVPDALLNIASSQIELGETAAARKTMDELVAASRERRGGEGAAAHREPEVAFSLHASVDVALARSNREGAGHECQFMDRGGRVPHANRRGWTRA